MARFAQIDIGAGKTYEVEKQYPDIKALEAGIADAWQISAECRN